MTIRAGVLTLSDRSYKGIYDDLSGPAVREGLGALGCDWIRSEVLPDDEHRISDALRRWCDEDRLDLIVTTGGTGPAPRDRTPEATRAILDFEIPGIPEALRAAARKRVPTSCLTRGLAGVRGRTVIVNLPGSPKAVREGAAVLIPLLPHLIDKVKGDLAPCGGA